MAVVRRVTLLSDATNLLYESLPAGMLSAFSPWMQNGPHSLSGFTVRRAPRFCGVGSAAALVLAGHLLPAQDAGDVNYPVAELEAFIVEETAFKAGVTLSPTARPSEAVFGSGLTLLETPRAVTVLTPEILKQFDVRSFEDLSRVSAGTSRPNIYGLAGSPFIRGNLGGVYFNGMLRIFNRNERPTGFGSLEAIDLVKGPAPASLAPTDIGGFASFIPKSPYYEEARGEVRLTLGPHRYVNTQLDIGAPFLLGNKPAAHRLSFTAQSSESYYRNVQNDYLSVYGAIKTRLSDKLRIYTGGELFFYQTNESVGWNRLTQDLIDRGEYVIGDADPNTTSDYWGGTADIFGFYDFGTHQTAAASGSYHPQLALVVPLEIFSQRFPSEAGALATGATRVFDPQSGELVGYKYTPEYFENGHEVFTTRLEGDEILADPDDRADSDNYLWFGDIIYEPHDTLRITFKSFFEQVVTRKRSSYGYALYSDTWKFEEKIQLDQAFEWSGGSLALSYGLDLQYTDSAFDLDFFAEPFNRRDLSTGEILPQSVVSTGPRNDRNNDGEWDLNGGDLSTFWQTAAFAQGNLRLGERFAILGGLRGEYVDWKWTALSNFVAPGADGTPQYTVNAESTRGDLTHYNANLNPVVFLTDEVSLYAAAQIGTVFQPSLVGGLNQGERHWAEGRLLELGTKASLLDGRLFLSAAVYEWKRTALTSTAAGDQEIDYKGRGVEFEAVYQPTDRLTIFANLGTLEVRHIGAIPFGTVPLTPEQIALTAGAIQYDVSTPPGERYANNPDLERAGFPETTASLFALYEFDNGFGLGAGPEYRSSFWGDIEHTLRFPSAWLWSANAFYRRASWEIFLRVNNLTDEDYFTGNDGEFADNIIATKGLPIEAFLSFTLKF